MDSIALDIRMGIRNLRLRPAFTAVAVLTLALGIGVNTAIFSVVHGVLLTPLPYSEPEELMSLFLDNRLQGWPRDVTSYPNHVDWKNGNSTFEDMSAWTRTRLNLSGDGEPLRALGVMASPNLMSLLGVEAAVGRVFTTSDWEGDPNVLVISNGFWRGRFGARDDAVGSKMLLNGNPYTIVGVMGPEFAFGSTEALYWMPFEPEVVDSPRGALWLNVVGRLKDGIAVEAARSDMDQVAARLEEELPRYNEGYGVTIVPQMEIVVGDVSAALWILLGAVGFVMLIACANVANMSLARAAVRQSEMAVRSALGADRRRLLRQMLTESVILSAAGGAVGLLLAFAGLRLLHALDAGLPRLAGVGIDGSVLGFTAAVVLATGVLFGLVPALRASRPDLGATLKEGTRTLSGGITGQTFRRGLVVAEIALALVLLVGAGLLIRSYAEIRRIDLGFEPDGLLMTSISLPDLGYPESSDVYGFFTRLLDDVGALPGVESVSAIGDVPLGPSFSSGPFTIAGRDPVARENMMEVKFNIVTPGHFATVGTSVLAGRAFEAADSIDGRRVVIINETMRRLHFPGEDPIGQQFLHGTPGGYASEEDPNPELPWFTIVGVVQDTPQRSVREPVEPEVFRAYAEGRGDSLTLVARTTGDPAAIAGSVRAAVWAIDPDLPVGNQGAISDLVADSSAQERLNFRLLGIFAMLAVSLAVVGIYGVMSYTVSQRTREIGIRMALGAERADIVRSVLGASLGVTLLGLVLGVAAALAMTRLMSGLLFGVGAADPLTFAAVALGLGITATAASLIPARRAARLDPTISLRD